jgi:hypothetical protein
MCGLGAFLRKGLTNLIPIIFALAGFPVYVASSQSAPFIVKLACGFGIERKIELVFPTKFI